MIIEEGAIPALLWRLLPGAFSASRVMEDADVNGDTRHLDIREVARFVQAAGPFNKRRPTSLWPMTTDTGAYDSMEMTTSP